MKVKLTSTTLSPLTKKVLEYERQSLMQLLAASIQNFTTYSNVWNCHLKVENLVCVYIITEDKKKPVLEFIPAKLNFVPKFDFQFGIVVILFLSFNIQLLGEK